MTFRSDTWCSASVNSPMVRLLSMHLYSYHSLLIEIYRSQPNVVVYGVLCTLTYSLLLWRAQVFFSHSSTPARIVRCWDGLVWFYFQVNHEWSELEIQCMWCRVGWSYIIVVYGNGFTISHCKRKEDLIEITYPFSTLRVLYTLCLSSKTRCLD